MDIEILGRALTTLPANDDHPYRTGPWRPQTVERKADDLDVIGEIPADLDGTYLRNTENPVHPAMQIYHPFDGDGMVHVVGFRDGKAFYRNRFVRTDGFLAEQESGRPLWAGLAEDPAKSPTQTGWGARGRMKDASSTDVVMHNGVALTSFYQCGDLYRLNPTTLGDVGQGQLERRLPERCGVSAHPKLDDRTGELLFFNYGTDAPFMHYGVVDAKDNLVHYVDVPLPGPAAPARHGVHRELRDPERHAAVLGAGAHWRRASTRRGSTRRSPPGSPSSRGVGRRPTSSGSRPTRPTSCTGSMRTRTATRSSSTASSSRIRSRRPATARSYQRMFRFLDNELMGPQLHRWRLNMATGLCKEEPLSDSKSEFGMINQQYAGLRHRYSYAATTKPGWFLFNGLLKHDTETGNEERYLFGEGVYGSETAMAPRIGSTSRGRRLPGDHRVRHEQGHLGVPRLRRPQSRGRAGRESSTARTCFQRHSRHLGAGLSPSPTGARPTTPPPPSASDPPPPGGDQLRRQGRS